MKKVHEQAHSRVCDICAKYFKCPESYERHYELEHSNIDQRVQCEICHHWFKHAYTLAGHMRRHKATQEICKYCGRVSKNKMTLRTHIRNMHSDVDTTFKPKNEFPCTICGKVFAKRQTLKVCIENAFMWNMSRFYQLLFQPFCRNICRCIPVRLIFMNAVFVRGHFVQAPTCMHIERKFIPVNMKRNVLIKQMQRERRLRIMSSY